MPQNASVCLGFMVNCGEFVMRCRLSLSKLLARYDFIALAGTLASLQADLNETGSYHSTGGQNLLGLYKLMSRKEIILMDLLAIGLEHLHMWPTELNCPVWNDNTFLINTLCSCTFREQHSSPWIKLFENIMPYQGTQWTQFMSSVKMRQCSFQMSCVRWGVWDWINISRARACTCRLR